MGKGERPRIGIACSYTPLPIIDAAGFVPYRILPLGAAPDQAGTVLHDNLCPHVKRILDRAVAGELPELAGVVFVNSCDTMRRLADAWQVVRPRDPTFLIDLPVSSDENAVAYLARELVRLRHELERWSGRPLTGEAIAESTSRYRELAEVLRKLARCAATGTLPGGRQALQELYNRAVTRPVEETLAEGRQLHLKLKDNAATTDLVPVYLFGNVLPDPEAFALFDRCGAFVVADDLCTGARQITPLDFSPHPDGFAAMARSLLRRPACARTMRVEDPAWFARSVVAGARQCHARGVIAHVMKFCDPYLVRLPSVRQALRDAGLPLLVLEGDCTLRALGQHRTRIQAFVEMLGEGEIT